MWKKTGVLLLTAIAVAGGLALGERLSISGVRSVIPVAEAVVGRPLTPVSVAGVARRTTRRCAVGVYNC
jgi:Ni,Fe-hydrogenase III small subunit